MLKDMKELCPVKPIEKELKHFVDNAKDNIKLHSIILFGSRARGDNTNKSDVDLLIIGEFQESFLRRPLILDQFNDTKYTLELFCYTPKEFHKMFKEGNVMILDALDEGRVLFGTEFFEKYRTRFNELVQKGLHRSQCTWVLP